MQLPITVVLISGMITGCAGGVLRDVLCNEVPLLFRKELYASVSVVTGALYLGAQAWGCRPTLPCPSRWRSSWRCACWPCASIGRCRSSCTATTGIEVRAEPHSCNNFPICVSINF